MKKMLGLVLFLFGETVILGVFFLLGSNLPKEILYLNVGVATAVYMSFFVDLIFPWIDLNSKYKRSVGTVGIRWFFTSLFTFFAVTAMLVFTYIKPFSFNLQLLVYGSIFFLFILGLFLSATAGDKIVEVGSKENTVLEQREEVRTVVQSVLRTVHRCPEVPESILSRINSFQEELRFLSPNNTAKAEAIDKDIITEFYTLESIVTSRPNDYKEVIKLLDNSERLFADRKAIYSN